MIKIDITSHEQYSLMILKGEIDASSSIVLDEHVKKAAMSESQHLIIDCTNLRYISSAGLGVFMSHVREFQESKGLKMSFFGLSPNVLYVFELLGLKKIFNIQSDLNTLLKAP